MGSKFVLKRVKVAHRVFRMLAALVCLWSYATIVFSEYLPVVTDIPLTRSTRQENGLEIGRHDGTPVFLLGKRRLTLFAGLRKARCATRPEDRNETSCQTVTKLKLADSDLHCQ